MSDAADECPGGVQMITQTMTDGDVKFYRTGWTDGYSSAVAAKRREHIELTARLGGELQDATEALVAANLEIDALKEQIERDRLDGLAQGELDDMHEGGLL